MGCMCTVPRILESPPPNMTSTARNIVIQSRKFTRNSVNQRRQNNNQQINRNPKKHQIKKTMFVDKILEITHYIINENFKHEVEGIMLASLALIESYGESSHTSYDENTKESAYGLCQMTMKMVNFMRSIGYVKYNVTKKDDLFNPKISLYFGAAYIRYLKGQNKENNNEETLIKEYFNNKFRKNDTKKTHDFYQCYVKAKSQLTKYEMALNDQQMLEEDTVIHVVKTGETLKNIAKICRSKVQDIIEINPYISNVETLSPGDCIELPNQSILPRFHVIRPGETMASIAKHYDVSILRLVRVNRDIKDPSSLHPGWIISIPGLKSKSFSDNDIIDMDDLIPSSFDGSADFLALMAEHYGLSFDENTIASISIPSTSTTQSDSIFSSNNIAQNSNGNNNNNTNTKKKKKFHTKTHRFYRPHRTLKKILLKKS